MYWEAIDLPPNCQNNTKTTVPKKINESSLKRNVNVYGNRYDGDLMVLEFNK